MLQNLKETKNTQQATENAAEILREASHIEFVHEKRHMFVWGWGGGGWGGAAYYLAP